MLSPSRAVVFSPWVRTIRWTEEPHQGVIYRVLIFLVAEDKESTPSTRACIMRGVSGLLQVLPSSGKVSFMALTLDLFLTTVYLLVFDLRFQSPVLGLIAHRLGVSTGEVITLSVI